LQQDKEKTWSNICYETLKEDKSWARRGLIEIVNRPDEDPLLQQKILNVEFTTVKIYPMGGKKVHIYLLEDEDLKSLMKDAEKFFNL
jgi:hypothetical protein